MIWRRRPAAVSPAGDWHSGTSGRTNHSPQTLGCNSVRRRPGSTGRGSRTGDVALDSARREGDDAVVTFPRRWRPNRLALAGMVVLGAVVGAGCSPAQSPRPNATASTSAPAAATVGVAAPSAVPAPPPPAANSTPAPPAFPAVVALSWLNGVAPEPAIRLPADGFVRWKGSAPGEQAELLPDGGYRWVGPDGSMVGCVAPLSAGRRHLRCVGMDAAGDTAVTADADGPRTVYGPGGRLLGGFTSSGARVAGPTRPSR